MNILVWLEIEEGEPTVAGLELLEEAAEIAREWQGKVVAVVLSGAVEATILGKWASVAGSHGANELLVVSHPPIDIYSGELYRKVLAGLVKAEKCAALLAPATPNGSDLLPGLAARLNTPLVSGCLQISGQAGGKLRLVRTLHNARLQAEYAVEASRESPVLATFRPGSRGIGEGKYQTEAVIREMEIEGELERPRVTSLGIVPPDPRSVDLVEAERIVAVGLGVSRSPGLEQAQELADCLGAAVGATRPVVDKGWLPFQKQIGTTGRSVSPRLYLALGISGASQHTGGLQGAKTIISVNLDRSAPMMALADLALVGDAGQIMPLLVKRLATRRLRMEKETEENVRV